jgi:hypothetical protein
VVSVKTQKMLWGRAAARCAFPTCRIPLVLDETETDDPALIGENCHIVSGASEGPRRDPAFPRDKIDLYGNLILLCRNHHREVDEQENKYTPDVLRNLKQDHEEWVTSSLESYDPQKQRDDEYYAGLVDKWVQLAHLESWHAWSSYILSGQPSMSKELSDDLDAMGIWIVGRVWPGRYPELESAFSNFQAILNDFRRAFHEHAEPVGKDGEVLLTRKFYKIDRWDEDLYRKLFKQFEFHVALVEDLMLELTRAANLICDLVRQYIMANFMLEKGRLLCQSGSHSDLTFHNFTVQYSLEERGRNPIYPGLSKFEKSDRFTRDRYFGEMSK